jgi:ketosteroid isomerase-like protein
MANDHDNLPAEVALRFNDCINNRDLQGLAALMTNDHTFIDSVDNAVRGKDKVVEAWKGFFDTFPDYQNIFEQVESRNGIVAILGRSICSEPQLNGPALWTATVRGEHVVEWRVYSNTPENRQALQIGAMKNS